ncbi:S-adenosyl-L-methionine-dependent methyltransferase [Tribonema minus]|uniref:S-adenosyl-L-methionine-dependent methyltransferase n=1 Tax=Tribonema minus TaxID=303371 RepID=A0A835Z107_9STRA|nr:S-adenosyl-L-methionine-dependent methyltransferase [Tribonema minus]
MNSCPYDVLDVGAGLGASTHMLTRSFPEARVTAVDVDSHSLAASSVDVFLRCHADAQSLPFEDACFDLVNLAYVVNEIPVDAASFIMAECARVTRHTGVIAMLDRKAKSGFTAKDLKYILEHAGYAVVDVDDSHDTRMVTAWRTVGAPIKVTVAVQAQKKGSALWVFELLSTILQLFAAVMWTLVILELIKLI